MARYNDHRYPNNGGACPWEITLGRGKGWQQSQPMGCPWWWWWGTPPSAAPGPRGMAQVACTILHHLGLDINATLLGQLRQECPSRAELVQELLLHGIKPVNEGKVRLFGGNASILQYNYQ